MPVEIFTKNDFELALPNIPGRAGGLDNSTRQYVYDLPVVNGMAIRVYSGIGASGVSADCGEDSIRAVIVRTVDGSVYGSKLKRWVTRQPGWRARLTDMLRDMWKLALFTGPCACGGTVGVYVVRKPGANKGRLFRKCDGAACRVMGGKPLFQWLRRDEKGTIWKEAA